MNTARRTVCLGFLAAFSCIAAPAGMAVPPTELEVIDGFLDAIERTVPEFKVLAIASACATSEHIFVARSPSVSDLQQRLRRASPVVIREFLKVVDNPVQLELSREAHPALLIYTVSEERLVQLFENRPMPEAWNAFRAAFPGAKGLARISRVGIDSKSGQALLFMSMTPGGLGGSGHLFLLQRERSRWSIVEDVRTWVS